jgi:hypothetical protein
VFALRFAFRLAYNRSPVPVPAFALPHLTLSFFSSSFLTHQDGTTDPATEAKDGHHLPLAIGNVRAAPGTMTAATEEATVTEVVVTGRGRRSRRAKNILLTLVHRGGGGGINPGNNLHVSNLSSRTLDSDLEEIFSKFGRVRERAVLFPMATLLTLALSRVQIQKIAIMKDPHTQEARGFAFVTMESEVDANAAIDGLNGTEVKERAIVVAKVCPVVETDRERRLIY